MGPNGVGKTNLLESLWCLATTRSFRANHEGELIRWEAAGAKVTGDDFEIRIVREPMVSKSLFIRGVSYRPLDYLGELKAVLFTPDSLGIISGSPSNRRRFLDTLLSQRSRQGARDLLKYRHVVASRNALLRLIGLSRARRDELSPWDSQLAELGARLTKERALLIESLTPRAVADFRVFGGQTARELQFTYQATGATDPEVFLAELHKLFDRELRFQATLLGPHRDDLAIWLDGRPIGEHGSRGEIRTALLAIKSAEYHTLLEKKTDAGLAPLLLLDDLFSELDERHREALGEFLAQGQTIITTTELAHLPRELQRKATVIQLSKES
jgi:DNA replication and repair protein RecF